MSNLNKDTHFIVFVPKNDASELDNIPEADEETKKECWAMLKGHDLDKVSGLSIYDLKPGYIDIFKKGHEITEVQKIGTGAVLVTHKSIL